MGAQLSCDVCKKVLSEEHDQVHEKKDGDPVYVCVGCFDLKEYTGYIKQSVYDVVGQENARTAALSGGVPMVEFQNMHACACGAETVRREGVTACFACRTPFPSLETA